MFLQRYPSLLSISFHTLRSCAGIGYEIPESDFETNKEYKRSFYVNIFPSGSKGENYRVPALIHATNYDGRSYEVEEATLPNGRVLTFSEYDEDMLELNKKSYTIADDGSGWEIELNDKPAN